MTFEPVERHSQPAGEPLLAVYQSGSTCRLNVAADWEWFADHDRVDLYADRDGERIALKPTPDGDYQLHRYQNQPGPSVTLTALFQQAWGVDLGDLADSQHVALEADELDGDAVVVGDVADVLAALRDDPSPAESDGDESSDADERPAVWRAAQEAESVAELADALDCDVSEARRRAIENGVYSDLADRPGEGSYGRDNVDGGASS